jgi:hypothetical protein
MNASECVATGGVSGDGWAGTLTISGSMSVTRTSAGVTDYTLTCSGATPASTSQTRVTFNLAPTPGGGGAGGGGSGGGSSGGGGSFDGYLLLGLLLGIATRMRRAALLQHGAFRHTKAAA